MTKTNSLNHMRSILALSVAVMMSGCGLPYFTEPKANPTIEQNFGEGYSALVTTAERRIVISSDAEKTGVPQMVCAEPSPDAIESIAASFGAEADVKISDPTGAEQSAKAAFARGVATSAGALTRRSQGVQFFRDGVFALCQGAMNGIASPMTRDELEALPTELKAQEGTIGREVIVSLFNKLIDTSREMVLAEVATEDWRKGLSTQPIAPPETELTGNGG